MDETECSSVGKSVNKGVFFLFVSQPGETSSARGKEGEAQEN